jgi:O-acetyl-ADP-ribose deacetylase (regulator of RNase III)
MNERVYKIGRSEIRLVFGDVTTSNAEVLVSSDDDGLSMGGGVSYALRKKGGEPVEVDASKHIPARLSDVIVTTAGALPAKYIFHGITIGDRSEGLSHGDLIDRISKRCMDLLDVLGLNSIAFPAIGAGVAGFNYDEVAVRMAKVISHHLQKRSTETHVSLYLFDRRGRMTPLDFVRFFEEFATQTAGLMKAVPVGDEEGREGEDASAVESAVISRRKEYVTHLAELGMERNAIESRLAHPDGLDHGEARKLTKRLDEIHRLRVKALAVTEQRVSEGARLFISYSHVDAKYRDECQKYLDALERQGLITTWFDRKITAGQEWEGLIDDNLERADVIVLLISQDFVASKYCYDRELTRALERHDKGEALVIPVLVRPVALWHDMAFAKLQALPRERKPVSQWSDADSAWVDVTEGIRTAIDDFARNKAQSVKRSVVE